jgi:hypothetical protein
MKLTVGPLPPAVYWRRRAAIAGTLLLLVITLVYQCSGGSAPRKTSNDKAAPKTTRSATAEPEPNASEPSQSFTPSDSTISSTPGDPGPRPSESAAASPAVTGPCTDAEMAVTAVAESTSVARGAFVKLTLKIKNISDRTCTRDVGADAQELYLVDSAKAKVWSSDACDAAHGSDVRTFRPGIESEFFVTWDGHATSSGCSANRPFPAAGRYQLVGRLAAKVGDPSAIEIK